jgi:hypothetical protein
VLAGAGDQLEQSDDADEVPIAARTRTEGERAAAKRAALLARGPTINDHEQQQFTEMFETVCCKAKL